MRKIHLDFHNSEFLKIGNNFSEEEFGKMLNDARVSQIVCFAKCIHGWSYYNTKAGFRHPQLDFDLLEAQIRACKKYGIRIEAYYTILWEHKIGQEMLKDFEENVDNEDYVPKYLKLNEAGIPQPKIGLRGFTPLCANSGLLEEIILPQVRELCKYELDGFFFDIAWPLPCFCPNCRKLHEEWKLDMTTQAGKHEFVRKTSLRMMDILTSEVRKHRPNWSVYFNGHCRFGAIDENEYIDTWEIESLPTGGWGYWHFPIMVRYHRTLPRSNHSKACLPENEPRVFGMTGRFSSSWGDFGSLKNKDALLLEAAAIMANGFCGVDIGDQMHPNCRLDPSIYEVIGETFKHVEEVEDWVRNSEALADMAVIGLPRGTESLGASLKGIAKWLVESHFQFDVVERGEPIDPGKYKVVIVPDYELDQVLEDADWERINEYHEKGGKVFLFGPGAGGKKFGNITLPNLSKADEWDVCYVKSDVPKKSKNYHPEFPYVCYSTFLKWPESDWTSEAELMLPYFKRTVEKYTSHVHSPVDFETGSVQPAVVSKDRIMWILAPIERQYWKVAYGNYRVLLTALLKKLARSTIVDASGYPPYVEITLTRQPKQERTMLHVINWGFQRPGERVDILEFHDELASGPIYCTVDRPINKARIVPSGDPVPIEEVSENKYKVDVPPVKTHLIIELS